MVRESDRDRREKLRQAIALQESLRGSVDEAIIEATIGALRKQLTELEATEQPEQRKLVTILFTDVVGSTEMIRTLDPEENLAIMSAALQRLAAPVEQQGGRLLRSMGDGFLAVFGVPVALETDPDRAVRAGLGILAAAQAYAQELQALHAIAGFRVRVGINTGLVAVSGNEGHEELTGAAVNLAARLESAAEPGTMLISQATYQHVRGVFDLQPQPPIQVKGFTEPLAVYRVTGEKARSFRTRRRGVEGVETRMVGRDDELKCLQDAYRSVIEEDQARAVMVIGDAGLGKSRLLYEFENWVDLQPQMVQLHRGRARPETQHQPHGLLRDLFAFRWGIQDDDSAQDVRTKVEAAFAEVWAAEEGDVDPDLPKMRAHFVGHVLGYEFRDSYYLAGAVAEPEQVRDRALVYLGEYFKLTSKRDPVLVLLEDLHWADESSLDALLQLVRTLANAPILFVGATRPTMFERRPTWFEQGAFQERLDLEPLSRQDSLRLVGDVLQHVNDPPEALRALIVENSEGNPFYMEELIKMLIEDGVILKGASNWQVTPERLAQVRVPSTLTGVLQARLDGLPAEERTILQQAAVIGRVFWDRTVAFLNERSKGALRPEGVENGLSALQARELVFRREESAFAGAIEYIFKHSILRDVTYESVLLRSRRTYHAAAAEWLTAQIGERAGELIGLIADHLERAEKKTEALSYLWQAGTIAAERYANEEALDYFVRALNLLKESGSLGVSAPGDVHEGAADVLNLLGRYDEALAYYADAYETLRAEKPSRRADLRLADLCRKTGMVHEQLAQFDQAFNWLDQGMALLDPDELTIEAVEIHLLRAGLLHRQGDNMQSIVWCERGLQMALRMDNAPAERAAAHSYYLLGLLYSERGDVDLSLNTIAKSLSIYERLDDQVGLARAYNNLGNIYSRHGKWPEAVENFERCLKIAGRVGSRLTQGFAANNLAEIHQQRGQWAEAERLFRQSREIWQQLGSTMFEGVTLSNLAQVYIDRGSLPEAERALTLSKSLFDKVKSKRFLPELIRRQASLQLKRGAPDAALALARQAVKLAKENSDRMEQGLAQAVAGRAGLTLGDLTLSADALQESLRLLRDLDLPYEAARTRLLLARLALKQGDADTARTYLNRATAVFRRLGAEADLKAARDLAGQIEDQDASNPQVL